MTSWAVWHLTLQKSKSPSRLLLRACGKPANNVEVNLGLDWSQTLVSGYQFTFTYTTKSFVFLPSQIAEKKTSRLENINYSQISKVPLQCFKVAIRRLARFNDSDTKLKQICAKEDDSTEEITQPKDFSTRVHLKYNKILIGDDKTNNDKI